MSVGTPTIVAAGIRDSPQWPSGVSPTREVWLPPDGFTLGARVADNIFPREDIFYRIRKGWTITPTAEGMDQNIQTVPIFDDGTRNLSLIQSNYECIGVRMRLLNSSKPIVMHFDIVPAVNQNRNPNPQGTGQPSPPVRPFYPTSSYSTSPPQPENQGTPHLNSPTTAQPAKVVKTLGDLYVGLQSLRILNNSGYFLTMTLSNKSPQRSIWVAVRGGMFGTSRPTVINPNGTEFHNNGITGIPATLFQNNGFAEATEISPGASIPVTMKFLPPDSNYVPSSGQCTVQMEFLLGNNFVNGFGKCTVKNLVTTMDAQ
jgi:hypothetical protein